MKRRNFIRHATRISILPAMLDGRGLSAFAKSPLFRALYQDAEETDRVLVMIYLGGGNDGLNTVVPMDQYGNLRSVRPHVILPQDKLLPLSGISDNRLHPSLKGFRNLFDAGKLGIIQNVGYPNQNYSHFRSTDIWMTAADADEVLATGWLGRYLNQEYPNYPVDYPNINVPDPLAVEIGYNLSVAFQGPVTGMGMVVADPEWFYQLVNNQEEPVPDSKAGEKLSYVRLITRQSQVYSEVIKKAASRITHQSSYPDTELGEQLRIVARLIAGGLQTRLYMVSIHGFDTHDSQVLSTDTTKGEHAVLLERLGDAVEAFLKDLEYLKISDKVMGATVSEFGRRIISNASFGTDHGAAAPMFVFGNYVSGGVFGKNPTIPSTAGPEDNLPMNVDFRTVYRTILKNWFCVSDNSLDTTIPHLQDTIPIIPDSACLSTSITDWPQNSGTPLLENYPNPFSDGTTIRFRSSGTPLQIQVYDNSGKQVETLVRGLFPMGWNEIRWNPEGLSSGIYHLRFQDKDRVQSRATMKQ